VRLRSRVIPRPPRFDPRTGAPGRVFLDADLVRAPLRVRGRRPGDRFTPLGAPGDRKLKSFLIDRKVPVDLRGRIPIVLSGDRIAWVMTQAIDDRFKVTPRTRRILVLEKETA
jgi:tRNA(Ile)-lysidine synthase